MRKAIVAVAIVALAAAAAFWGVRRVGPGEAAWSRSTGRLLVPAEGAAYVPSWRWQHVASARVVADAPAVSKEGARVVAGVTVMFPAGTHALAPGDHPADGLAAAVADTVRGKVEALSLRCLTGLDLAGCPGDIEAALGRAVAGRLGVPAGAVSVRLALDPVELAALRLSALQELVGRPSRRVLVVGWDGADWEILEPFARRGVMPNLARLMSEGSWGELASVTPLLSPLIWTTMATGAGADEHGILDFVEVDPGTGAKVPVSGRQRRVPALWNMASAAGLSVNVSGWWASWPAEPVKGVVVSDRLFFLLSDTVAEGPPGTVVYPPAREPEFRALAERAEKETDEGIVRSLLPVSDEAYRKAIAGRRGMNDPIDGFRRIMVGTRTYFGATMLESETPADLTMVYTLGTDEIGHLLSPYLPPPLAGADPAFSAIAATGVERYFSVIDRWLGRLLATCPQKECAVLVVSDHGFKWGGGAAEFTSGAPGGRGGAFAPGGSVERRNTPPQRDDRPREFSGTAAATAALWHRPKGIFVLAGKGVAKLGRVSEPPSVFDVAPTVAALLGLPPGKWRGKPLPGCPPATHAAVNWSTIVPPESYHPAVPASTPSPEYVKQLKALGYLETGEGTGQGKEATEGELNNLGLVHLEAKRFAEADKAFRAAIERNPGYASPHYNLRRLYFETGRYEEADAELWRAVDLKLRDPVGSVDRAASDYERTGNPERAASLLLEGMRRFPREARLEVHRLALLMQLNRCPEAAAEGRQAAETFPADARVQAFFGLASACAGDRDGARRAFQRSLQLDPNQPEIRQALAELSDGG